MSRRAALAAGRQGDSGMLITPFRPQNLGLRSRASGARALLICAAMVAGMAVPAEAKADPKLLLLPIVVHSAEDPEYLRNGLADMLSARFSRIGALELLRPAESEAGTTNLAKALKLGREAGADFVLYGSFTRFGQGASLDVQCSATDQETDRAPLREIFVHSGSIGEIIPDLDELAGKVSRFARGEELSSAAPKSSAFSSGGAATQDLMFRIEALEEALAALQEAADDEPSGELR
jgi:TolB-like protein